MDSIPVGGQGFLGLDIDPVSIADSGVVKVYVYQVGNYSNGDTITWNITAAAVGVEEISANSGIKIFPNPESTTLIVNNRNSEIVYNSAYITDAIRRIVFKH